MPSRSESKFANSTAAIESSPTSTSGRSALAQVPASSRKESSKMLLVHVTGSQWLMIVFYLSLRLDHGGIFSGKHGNYYDSWKIHLKDSR